MIDILIRWLGAKAIDSLFEPGRVRKEEQRKRDAAEKEQMAKDQRQRAEEQRIENARREAQGRAARCCARCGTVVSGKAGFCQNCGGSNFTTLGQLYDKKVAEDKVELEKKVSEELLRKQERAEKARREQQEREAKERYEQQIQQQKLAAERARRDEVQRQQDRRKAARDRCLELLAMRYCPPCSTAFPSKHKFCTTCGTATEEFLPTWAFEYARTEYRDILNTEDDFKQLVNERNA